MELNRSIGSVTGAEGRGGGKGIKERAGTEAAVVFFFEKDRVFRFGAFFVVFFLEGEGTEEGTRGRQEGEISNS